MSLNDWFLELRRSFFAWANFVLFLHILIGSVIWRYSKESQNPLIERRESYGVKDADSDSLLSSPISIYGFSRCNPPQVKK